MSWLFASSGQSMGAWAWASASVLPMSIQSWFFLESDWLIWSPCCPRDSQESSPAPQFESINSLTFSLLYGPTLRSIHDYWKSHSFVYTEPLLAKWCLCFLIHCPGLSQLFFQQANIFYFCACSHCPQWFQSPRKWNLSLFPLFPCLFAMKWWDWMPWS